MQTNKSTFKGRFDYLMHEAFGNEESKWYRIVNNIIVVLIFVSIVLVSLESVTSIAENYGNWLNLADKIVVGIFTVEYLANIYVAKKKTSYVFGVWGIIDFLAIAPSYVSAINLTAIKVLRVVRILRFLRLMRMLRLLKLAKKASHEFSASKEAKVDTLRMDLQIYFIALFSVLIIFSTLMYYAEQSDPETAFTSIPQAMWWCIVTITTVGYGDMYPHTILGRLVASGAMLSGLALFGLLTNVIGKSMMSSLFGTENLDDTKAQIEEAEESVVKK